MQNPRILSTKYNLFYPHVVEISSWKLNNDFRRCYFHQNCKFVLVILFLNIWLSMLKNLNSYYRVDRKIWQCFWVSPKYFDHKKPRSRHMKWYLSTRSPAMLGAEHGNECYLCWFLLYKGCSEILTEKLPRCISINFSFVIRPFPIRILIFLTVKH